MSRTDTIAEPAAEAAQTLDALVALGSSGPRRRRRPPTLSWHGDDERHEAFFAPAVLATASALVALWPYTSVISPGTWSFTVLSVVLTVALVGFGMRIALRYRPMWVRELSALVAQVLASIGVVTLLVAGDTAVFGLVPTPTSLRMFESLTATAWEQVLFGSAPLDSTPGLRLLMGAGFAILTILLDQLIATRGAVLASLLVAVVGAVPMIVTLGEANIVWFVLLAIVVLLLFRSTARRHPDAPRRDSSFTAIAAGAAAVVAALVVAPAVPVSATLAGSGIGVTVDASLRLGEDLRQPNPVEVLTLATSGKTAPYLRLTTLSDFNGRTWVPDRGELQSTSTGFGPAEWGEDVSVAEQTTSIRVLRMSSSWLPVPYPATSVQGVGAAWMVMPENRTLVSRNADAVGNDYTVASSSITPSLEQIRALSAAETSAADDEVELPEIIPQTAAEVTATATTDYDRLIAMQSWFRTQFIYSLDTPVEEDFDGTGAQAVAKFLEVRSGYCVHFAGAFALMAQSLGMETRIVVGYLPGTRTQEKRGDEAVYSVSSDQLHSWPEVLFPGIGWVPFEPTATLGTPTAFSSAATSGGTGGSATPAPTTRPDDEETPAPEVDRNDAGGGATGADGLRRLDPTPVVLGGFGVLLIVLLPMLIRLAVRAMRLGRARRGDAGAAWTELRATLIDLQIAVSDADSPRRRARGLVTENGVDGQAMKTLTDAVERASYARSAEPADLAPALGDVLHRLRASVDRPARVRALLMPRSLVAGRAGDAPLLA
ncbi:transglutaminaseTgpA domain-containing protein [Microbacterium sp. ZW T6_19]|uniref:transglutaminase family protein n=1 Tax=Microbacterium sp. ZW T6_19 TaxID=3378082 RepID=UPI0038523792